MDRRGDRCAGVVHFNVPVTWLERRRVPRWAGTAIVLLAVGVVVVGVGAVVGPRDVGRGTTLFRDSVRARRDGRAARIVAW